MKAKSPLTAALIGAFALGAVAPAFSYDPDWDSPGARPTANQGQGAAANRAADTRTAAELAGSPASVTAATRTVSLAGTRYVNAVQGEVIKFVAGDKAFAWRFDTLNVPSFKLADIAPKDFPTGDVEVFVAPDPAHLGG